LKSSDLDAFLKMMQKPILSTYWLSKNKKVKGKSQPSLAVEIAGYIRALKEKKGCEDEKKADEVKEGGVGVDERGELEELRRAEAERVEHQARLTEKVNADVSALEALVQSIANPHLKQGLVDVISATDKLAMTQVREIATKFRCIQDGLAELQRLKADGTYSSSRLEVVEAEHDMSEVSQRAGRKRRRT